jgi:WD40 repeat protein
VSYCLNPKCPNPSDLSNTHRDVCRHCGTELLVAGRYRLVRPLGGGGFGKTFEVNDGGILKVLKILYKNHPKAVELFRQEGVVLSRIRHPGVPKVEPDGYFTFLPNTFREALHCLVMEKIQGLNLEEWMKERQNKPLKESEAIDCLKKIVEILEQVHQQQFFHRDIKPLNIMRRPNGQFVLIDFGAAREVTGTYLAKVGQGQNVTGIVSPGYTPPEQVNGKAVPQSDFYALGRTFVYLLTGNAPTAFPENPRTGKLIWRDHAPQLSPEFADVIDYLMAPFPGNRPQNAQMILQCLNELDPRTATNTAASLARRQSGNSSGTSGRGSQLSVGDRSISAFTRKRREQKLALYRKRLIRAGWILLLIIAGTQLFSFIRYDTFPANPIRVLVSLPNSRFLQKSINGNVGVINAVTVTPVPISVDQVTDFVFASASFGTIRLWDRDTGNLLHTFAGHENWVKSLAVNPNSQILASGGDDKTIRLWNLEDRFRMLTIPAHSKSVNALVFTPDGQLLISGSDDRTIKWWRVPSGQRLLTLSAHAGAINALAVSPDSQILASGSDDNTIKLWDLNTGRVIATLTGHNRAVISLAISPNGQTLVSGSRDNSIKIWNLKTGQLVRTLAGHNTWVRSLAISPDSSTLVSGADSIKIWDLRTGQLLHTLLAHSRYISGLAISPDGETLVSGGRDQTLKIWRMP